jgi:Alpha/beta hydrolase domain
VKHDVAGFGIIDVKYGLQDDMSSRGELTLTNTASTIRPLPPPVPQQINEYDVSALGYLEEEYVLEGTATSYRIVGDRTSDGAWTTEQGEDAAFATRLLVRRPSDPSHFSGTVIVEWFNVSGGLDAEPDWVLLHRHLVRQGHAWVGVSAQKAGIDGGGFVEGPHLKKAFPDRYGMLFHPGDPWAFDIFTRAGQVLRRSGDGSLLGPLAPTVLLAAGESQSAAFLVTYVNAVDPHAAVYDGFLIHGRPGSGAGLQGFNIGGTDDLEDAARVVTRQAERVRQDARVPVLVLQSETDVTFLGGGQADQPDGDRVRLWELAGAAHADTYILVAGGADDGELAIDRLAELLRPTSDILGVSTGSPINSGPQQHYVGQAALEHLHRWVTTGVAPPRADRLERTSDGLDLFRDQAGIAIGGIRTPWVDVPVAVLSGLGQTGAAFSILFGTTVPFDHATLAAHYPGGRKEYLDRFEVSLQATIETGFILAVDGAEILSLASASFPSE